ncbi:MAG: hypothetical protein OES38_13020, partial [Gammaproteobacteria bacterium]|nr:hypothetical protein [Gammaproteobacteria bacterium]
MTQAHPSQGRAPKPLLAGAALAFTLLIGGCSEQTNVSTEPISSDPEAVTFYPTYGYQRGASWIIPLRIWVHEQPNALKALVGDAARDIIAGRAEIESLTDAEEQRFDYRTAHFVTDAESREQVIFVFDDDPLAEQFQIVAEHEPVTSDLNGLIEG